MENGTEDSEGRMTLDLDALEALEKKATQGRWMWDSDPLKDDPMSRRRYRVCVTGKTVMQTYHSSGDVHAEPDTVLTCAARNALPELLRLARLGQRVERDAKESG